MQLETRPQDPGLRLAYWLGLAFVLVGLTNAIPGIPGLDQLAIELTGDRGFKVRKFSYEYFYPIAFSVMMTIVVLKHSMWRAWDGETALKRTFGLLMDVGMLLAAYALSLTYLIEIEAVCLIDTLTGERAELIARALAEEREFAELYGLPVPDSVEDPKCLNTTGIWLVAIVALATCFFLGYNVKVWGLLLVIVSIGVAAYTIITVIVWYVHGPDDISKYLMTKLGGEPRQLIDGRPRVHDILTNNAQGFLGRFMDIILNTVFPYIVLGAPFGISAGAKAMIKLAFYLTRNIARGPAHPAILSPAPFRTLPGSPAVNVRSNRALPTPTMLPCGFSIAFSGSLGAAAPPAW